MTGGLALSVLAIVVGSVAALVAGITILVGARSGETWVGLGWTLGGLVLAYVAAIVVQTVRRRAR